MGTDAATGTNQGPNQFELGVRFRATVDGTITGIRMWQRAAPGDTPAVGHIWDSVSQVELAVETFGTIVQDAWNEVTLSTPLHITASDYYIVSANTSAPNYPWKQDTGGPPAVVGAHLEYDPGNDIGRYSTTAGAFPVSGGGVTCYWRDIIFVPD